MEEPEFTKDPGITEPLDDHLGQFFLISDWLPRLEHSDWLFLKKSKVVQCVDEEQLAHTKSDMQRKGI